MELGSKPIKCYWWYYSPNFGDMISKPILEHFTGQKIERAEGGDFGKFMAVGSIIETARPGDTIWGSGHNRYTDLNLPKNVKILAVRGPITRKLIRTPKVPEVYGDPAILLPLIYNPVVEKKYEIGVLPHYVDKEIIQPGHMVNIKGKSIEGHIIDVQSDWKTIIDEIKACNLVITSSLHGIIASEVYGIPVIWATWSNKIVGGEMKYQDYFLGTGRDAQSPFKSLYLLENLEEKQNVLLEALEKR